MVIELEIKTKCITIEAFALRRWLKGKKKLYEWQEPLIQLRSQAFPNTSKIAGVPAMPPAISFWPHPAFHDVQQAGSFYFLRIRRAYQEISGEVLRVLSYVP